MKRVLTAACLVGLLLAPPVARAQVGMSGDGREQVAFTTITRQVHGGPKTPTRAVINSAEQYARFFRTDAPAPCDFTKEYMVVIHLGTIGSEGYSIKVDSVERVKQPNNQPAELTINYSITKGDSTNVIRTQEDPLSADPSRLPFEGQIIAPAEVIRLARPTVPERLRFFEKGGQERAGFNAIARTLSGQKSESHLVDFSGTIKARYAGDASSDPRQTRITLAELERLAVCVNNAALPSLPRTLPTEAWGGTRVTFTMFDMQKKRTTVEGTRKNEGVHADKVRPLDHCFELILSRIEGRGVELEGTIQRASEADTVKLEGTLGLTYELRGPLARLLSPFEGRRVNVQAIVQLRTANVAEGVIRQIGYPQRQQLAGLVLNTGSGFSLKLSPPMPEIPVKLSGERASELVGPEVGNTVLLDSWVFFDTKGIPNECIVEAIRGMAIAPLELRDRPEAVSLPTGVVDKGTSVWVTSRKGGKQGVCNVAGQKSGWAPAEFIRFSYTPPPTAGMRDALDAELRKVEDELAERKAALERARARAGSSSTTTPPR